MRQQAGRSLLGSQQLLTTVAEGNSDKSTTSTSSPSSQNSCTLSDLERGSGGHYSQLRNSPESVASPPLETASTSLLRSYVTSKNPYAPITGRPRRKLAALTEMLKTPFKDKGRISDAELYNLVGDIGTDTDSD